MRLSANLSIAIGKFEIAEKNLKEIFSNFNPSIEDFELKIYFFIQLKEIQKAKRNYLQAIHLFPSNRILRISFLKFLKYYFPKDSSQFSIFIENLPNYSLPSSSSYYSSHLLDLSPLPFVFFNIYFIIFIIFIILLLFYYYLFILFNLSLYISILFIFKYLNCNS